MLVSEVHKLDESLKALAIVYFIFDLKASRL
jgi:hypothetical protein